MNNNGYELYADIEQNITQFKIWCVYGNVQFYLSE